MAGRRLRSTPGLLLAWLAIAPSTGAGQAPWEGTVPMDSPRGEVGAGLLLAVPTGEFRQYVDLGGGGGGYGLFFVGERRAFALRGDASWLIYGSQTVRRPLSPTVPFVDVDVTTRNSIASVGLGPHFELPGGRVRPYLFGTVGLSYFWTDTQVEGTENVAPFATTRNYDDLTFALAGGLGTKIQVRDGQTPIAIDVSAHYLRNGLTRYLREGSLRELPGGGWTVDPIESETNLWALRLGVVFGLR